MCKNSGVNHGILCAFQLEGQDSAFKPPLPFQPGSLAFFFCFLWRAAAMPGSPQEQQHFRAEVRSGIRAAPAAHRLGVPRSERCCCSLCRPLNTLVMFQWKRGQKVAGPWWHEGTVMAPLLDGSACPPPGLAAGKDPTENRDRWRWICMIAVKCLESL